MIAAKFGDPVLGIDIHAVIPPPPVPPPGPPTPLPHPFVGVVFDPIGAAMGAAMGAVFGGGGPVFVNGMPVGNAGTAVKAIPHIPTPPGVGPHPSDAPTGNEGTLITGSKTVHFGGSSESRTLSVVMSCSYPINLPTSVCMAVPMGAPVLIGGPEAVDWEAAATSAIRTKWVSDKLHGLLKAKPKSWTSKAICFLTGHPVDVMTGELIAEATDFDIPGLIPIVWERNYRSRQTREGALGPGWSHPFDEIVEESADGTTLWLGDGRPKAHRALRRGDSEWDAEERYTIERTGEGYDVLSWDGVRRLFRRTPSAKHFVLTEIRNRAKNTIRLTYERGYLVAVEDTAGRRLEVAWTKLARMEGVYFEGKPLTRYTYDAENRLAAAIDPLGHALRYAYRGGVMVKETHKSGLAFFFEWDWEHPEGWCVKTWGENPTAAKQPGEPEGVPRFIYVRKIRYVPEKHFTSVEDGRGGITQYWGNALGLVEKEMDPGGVVTEYTWDADRRKLSETDGEGNRTESIYDGRGNCILTRNADGGETRRTFDDQNQLVEVVEPGGPRWALEWGSQGKPLSLTDPSGAVRRYLHDDAARLIQFDDPMGRTTRATWTDQHQLATLTAGSTVVGVFEYDSLGRLVRSTDAAGRTSRAARDAAGQLVEQECFDGERLQLRYDAEGNAVEQVDSLGRSVERTYAGLNQLVQYRDPAGNRVRLRYDSEEKLIALENAAREEYRFERDLAGRVRTELAFDGRRYSYVYDKAGRSVRELGPDNAVAVTERDQMGRIRRRSMKAGPGYHAPPGELARAEEESFEYDSRGRIVEATNPAGRVHFERDELGRVVREQNGTFVVTSRRDPSGRRIERETTLGHRTQYTYDALGDLSEIRAGLRSDLRTTAIAGLRLPSLSLPEWHLRISRDSAGLELARRSPGGVVSIWKRDQRGRPDTREVLAGAFPGRLADQVSSVRYQWQSADQIESLTDTVRGATRFEYDSRGHLASTLLADGTRQHRAMDQVSNVFRRPEKNDRSYRSGGVIERVGSTEYRHDSHGNLVEKTLADGAQWKYRWTTSGNLAEITRPDGGRVRLEYDALGRRVRKELGDVVTEYAWDGDHLVHERVSRAGVSEALTTWIFEPSTFTPVAKFEGRQRYSIVTDHLGIPNLFFDEEGRVVWRGELDSYGVVRPNASIGTVKNPWRYPGQYEDEETGLYYNRFRYYDPELGRYISADPSGPSGGLALYAYVPVPMLQVDPLGLSNSSDASELRTSMEEADMKPPPFENDAHHIVASNDPKWDGAREHMESMGVKKNSAPNGVYMPSSSAVAEAAGTVTTPHSRIHTRAYRENVIPRVLAAENEAEMRKVLAEIRQEILDGKPIHKKPPASKKPKKGC